MEMLDETFGLLGSQDISDSNTYTLGRIGQHNVVIACLPAGQYGNTSATTVANNMVRTFSKSLRIGLMVGVGGGIPSATRDIRLGDVVISCPEGTTGGVLQYDMGKVGAGGEFHRIGSLNSAPRSLLTAVNLMRASELRDDPRFLEYLTSAIARNRRTQKSFGRPSIEQDRLFKPEHNHPATASTCCGCLAEWQEARSERDSSDPQPHYGIIASGNAVIKDAWTREQLRLQTGALCFEMEAAGLMLDFPCIIIRGICDYADSHKNKQWQGYAALTAASYAKELLGYIPLGRVSQERLVVDACSGLRDEVKGTNKLLDQAYNQREQHHREKVIRALTDQQKRCHQVFKLSSSYEQQKNIIPRREEGTCQWALQSPKYTCWLESKQNDLLWVSADPGCGKSVLARSIIDDYLEASNPVKTICYFFFKDNDEQNQLAYALCSVLHQLFSQRPGLLHYAIPSWEKYGERLQQEVDELWRIFIAAASADLSHQTICIFDALDESREIDQGRLIEKLYLFRRQPSSSKQDTYLKFLVTSRPYDHIKDQFRAITDSFPQIHLKGEEENDRIHEEIDLVIKIRARELAETVPLSTDLHRQVEDQLLQMGHRTYLWLHLAIDDIRATFKHSLRPKENSIRLVPSSVNAAYEKILYRVPINQMDIVKKVLEIIVAARRPLTIQEMAIALGIATSSDSQTIKQAELDPVDLEEKLRQLCGLFIFTHNSKIYLIHQTAREFLIKKGFNNLNYKYWSSLYDAEDLMAQICLRFLLMDDLEYNKDKSGSHAESFLEYSGAHWAGHVREMTLDSYQKETERIHRLYDVSGKSFSIWFPIFWKAARPYDRTPMMSALHLAAFNGHEQEIYSILDVDGSDINTPDSTVTYPVMWASLNGHDKTVELLLERGADINAQGGEYGNALQSACRGGHDKIVELLLERGADVNVQGGFYENDLQAACRGGNNKIVELLLEQGADVNAQSRKHGNALQSACRGGHDNIVELLLERGADVNAQGGFYENSLQAACLRGHNKIVEILLKWGADVNAQSGKYGNALQSACRGGHNKIVELLLEQGADINAQSGKYRNALQSACLGGFNKFSVLLADSNSQDGEYRNTLQAASEYDKIVELLLERGADVNAQGGFYENALQAACRGGHDKIVELLLERGADTKTQSGKHENALQAACLRGHDNIVELLLERGADVNAQSGKYGNALQAACLRGHNKIVEILLKWEANVNAQSGKHRNALQAACLRGYDNIVELLLERGAHINDQSGKYGNALQAACRGGHDNIVELLLERGADVNAQGGFYENAFQAACFRGHYKIVKLLVEQGADINAQSGKYGNALQAACLRGYDKVVKLLVEQGADVNAQGGKYGNALQAACLRGHDNIVELLLERGADVNAQSGKYGNALQAACLRGHNKIVEILLNWDANVNAQNGKYGNALQAACRGGYNKVVELLLERGADVNAQGGFYENALQAACRGGHNKIVELLLERGADVNTQGGEYGNALQAACLRGYDKIVELLLERGADVNIQSGKHGNALQAACLRGHDNIVELLLEQGADINAQSGKHGNALQAACLRGYDKIVGLLLERGANVNIQSGKHGNALQAAYRGGYDKIVELLLERGADINA
ncbi:hypothetical protein N7495_001820 [Penicillium taxi]|uniref:uncharacterized protein n=1 Tax=Penicillium taxi TaxID=168475 RepID=UPI002545A649|nr:uncharacterized protein N7495_001820 [Penicillium taxi]KAJ5909138.1 hypothetical protein N7495_001820 [Penicillium taxi]